MRGQDRRPTDPWTSAGPRWWAEGTDREEARGAPLPGRTPAASGRSGAAALGRGRRFAGPSPARPLLSPKVWPPERLPSLVPRLSPLWEPGGPVPAGSLPSKSVFSFGPFKSPGTSSAAQGATLNDAGSLSARSYLSSAINFRICTLRSCLLLFPFLKFLLGSEDVIRSLHLPTTPFQLVFCD